MKSFFKNLFKSSKPKEEGLQDFIEDAQKEDIKAQYLTGVCYEGGNGVEQDYSKAAEYYMIAAKRGLAIAQYRLGLLYYHGRGVAKDLLEAESWFMKAAEKNEEGAHYYLGLCYYGREVYKDALINLKIASDQGIKEAQYLLGTLYENGLGTPQDFREAFRWYQMSAEQDMAEACYKTGLCYEYGAGVEKAYDISLKWYWQAHQLGHQKAYEKYLEVYHTSSARW